MPRSARHNSFPFMSHAISSPIDPNAAAMRRPSVAGVELAWVAFVCRLTFGVPENAVRSQTIFPVDLSSAYTFHSCSERSSTGFTSPYNPVRKLLSPALLMAVVTNTRLPHVIGLEFAIPGIAVFHLMFFPLVTSHSVTARWPSPFPAAASPRNEGQFLGAP